jgi:hypothetical protein
MGLVWGDDWTAAEALGGCFEAGFFESTEEHGFGVNGGTLSGKNLVEARTVDAKVTARDRRCAAIGD